MELDLPFDLIVVAMVLDDKVCHAWVTYRVCGPGSKVVYKWGQRVLVYTGVDKTCYVESDLL